MASTNKLQRISPTDLDDILAKARAGRWSELVLLGPNCRLSDRFDNWPDDLKAASRVFQLTAPVEGLANKLSFLTDLTSLNLPANSISDAGARAIAALTNLTSLHLYDNSIGDAGARAIAALTNLTSLDLRVNSIGIEGVEAIAASLTSLTSLGLGALPEYHGLTVVGWTSRRNGYIGADGARAIAGSLPNLTELSLAKTNIGAEGAHAIAALTDLTSLNLSDNSIGAEGAQAIATLTNLTSLDLWHNSIGAEGAKAIAALTNLSSLNLTLNSIGAEGAQAIAALTNLTSLTLSFGEIGAEGAQAIAALSNLSSLHLGSNSIGAEGAQSIAALTNLTSLDLSYNSIRDAGARAIAALTNLTSLDLRKNRIGAEGAKAVLDAWSAPSISHRMQYLDLQENGDFGNLLPMEVLKNIYDPHAILAAYRSFRSAEAKQTLRPLNEAKLLVVGSEAVGKTSLLRYLIHSEPRNPSEAMTPGIATHEKIETETWSPEESSVCLNVWDFGGQEMMRGTHRFFLTARSLYLLVMEDRRQDDRSIHDWLKTIRNRGAESPILVIINKSDDGKRDLRLDEEGLKRAYPNIVTFLRAACNDDDYSRESIQALRRWIIKILGENEHLKHVRDPIPDSWLEVKKAVSDLASERSVLPHDDFRALCRENGIEDENEQRSLLRLLHDLGTVVAHGLDRDALAAIKSINLLDPNWLTGAIYHILNHPKVRDQDGEFTRVQLEQWLDPTRYRKDHHEFILSMMQDEDVGLCFRVPDDRQEGYLIPEALRPSAPEYEDLWPSDSLRFRYKYGFLPRGLIPRFIVQAHRNLTKKKTRWWTGGVFEVAGCKILVEGHVGMSPPRIDIAVCGVKERRRSALQVILNHFDHVHELNPECEPEAYVPLPDRPERDVMFNYLLKLEEVKGGEYEFIPERAEHEYSVGELLSGVPREHREQGKPRTGAPEKLVEEVFVSYAWENEAGVAFVDRLEEAFAGRGIKFIRDKSEMNYKDSIRDFMKRLGSGKCIVVIVSDAYLKSDSCMFELVEIEGLGDMRDRVCPIVLEDAEIFKPKTRLRYVKHWETEIGELEAEMEGVGRQNLQGIREWLDLYHKIRNTVATIMEILGDMNALTPQHHRGSDFTALFEAIERQLAN